MGMLRVNYNTVITSFVKPLFQRSLDVASSQPATLLKWTFI